MCEGVDMRGGLRGDGGVRGGGGEHMRGWR